LERYQVTFLELNFKENQDRKSRKNRKTALRKETRFLCHILALPGKDPSKKPGFSVGVSLPHPRFARERSQQETRFLCHILGLPGKDPSKKPGFSVGRNPVSLPHPRFAREISQQETRFLSQILGLASKDDRKKPGFSATSSVC
jgi:hypothetical protein